MRHTLSLLGLIAAMLVAALARPAAAQTDALGAHNVYALGVFSYPNHTRAIIDVLVPRTQVIVEARSSDTLWVLVHDLNRTVRGWVETRFLEYEDRKAVLNLPVSAELMFIASESPQTGDYAAINLEDYPVIPDRLGGALKIAQNGALVGSDPYVISKVGDCISDNKNFLSPFGWGEYALGNYSSLQPVIDQFALSLAFDSQSAYDGLVTTAALDPLFSNPLACQPGESPLRCEYRVHNPSVAIIMFGAQDLLFTPPAQFDRNLRQIVHETIQAGVIPLLSTFPGNLNRWDDTVLYNQIIVQIALDYDIPLMNLWLALEALPHHGLDDDGRHLSVPISTPGDLRGENLQRGYPQRNLVTLQALDAVWRGALQPVMGSLYPDVYTAPAIG
ncbi:SGNH/GDSL hydrolase family protein [Aggregatilinea lenta]|uniref:SGNH/GDSL hydrolase family protein n=1 Tax=Aggregatilinea lenta TaxID=913108 RepID=UPI0013C2F90A|nr:SGNH/GDSL hydrolase family protein [Aggregatilinea lenta]